MILLDLAYYLDTINATVTGISLREATTKMNELYYFLMGLPGMNLIDKMETEKRDLINKEIDQLIRSKAKAEALSEDSPLFPLKLHQRCHCENLRKCASSRVHFFGR